MKIECTTPEELQHYKDRATMLKMLVLDSMNKDVKCNVSNFSKRDKIKLQVEIERRWDEEDIVKKFNELCVQTIFEDGKMNIEELSVEETSEPKIPEAELKHLEEYLKNKLEEKENLNIEK